MRTNVIWNTKKTNAARVRKYVMDERKRTPFSSAELLEEMGESYASINSILGDMERKQLLIKKGSGGRNPRNIFDYPEAQTAMPKGWGV